MLFSLLAADINIYIIMLIILASVLSLLICLSMHEFSHAWVATKCGDETPRLMGRVTLNPLKHLDPIGTIMLLILGFGWAKPVPVNVHNFRNQKKGMFLVSFAGPLMNIVLGILASIVYYFINKYFGVAVLNFEANSLVVFGYYLSYMFLSYNFALAIFNLLPIFPLDGFNMVYSLTASSKYYEFNVKYGQWILLGVVILGGFTFLGSAREAIIDVLLKLWALIFR